MKSNGQFNFSGYLLPQYWQPWAEYFVKFLKAYETEGLPMWGLTAQNEPEAGKHFATTRKGELIPND